MFMSNSFEHGYKYARIAALVVFIDLTTEQFFAVSFVPRCLSFILCISSDFRKRNLINMKTSSVLLGLVAVSTALAAPEPARGWKGKGGKWDKWGSKKFTSTYSVVATPKQVVDVTDDGDYFYTGGLPVSIAPYSHEK